MTATLKVLWTEGLTLDAQHLQQQDRYHESRLQHIAATIEPHHWGVQHARWALPDITSNTLCAQALTLIFKDGEIYQAPLADALPLPIDLSKLPADAQSVTFYAALPMTRTHGGNLAPEDNARNEARYTLVNSATPDLFSESLPAHIDYLRKAVRLLSDLDVREGYDCLPVIRLQRRADGSFDLDPYFMPPCVSISADASMQDLLRSVLARLGAKCESLHRLQRQPRGHVVELHAGDVATFWMLQTIMSASATLMHLSRSGHCHPERLFERLMALAGGLMAFSRKYTITDLPTYNHEQPASGFHTLNDIIRDLLDTVVSSKYISIPLTISDQGMRYHHAALDPTLLERKAALYIAVNASMPALNLVAEVPRQLKIASPHEIDALVRSALPGVPLSHMPQVPMEVPVRPETYYFSLEHRGDLYEAILKAQSIAIYAPATLTDLRLELFAISP